MIILHGLYGSSDNWISIARQFEDQYEIFLPDQRNHGQSPHHKDHNFEVLKNDLAEFMEGRGIDRAILIGHSMGGKTVMYFADTFPEKVSSLIVLDISPRSYKSLSTPSPHIQQHTSIISAMQSVDFSRVESREDISRQMAGAIPEERIHQFLLKNVEMTGQKTYRWGINLEALKRNLPAMMEGMDIRKYQGGKGITGFPVLFVKGKKSNYIMDQDLPIIKSIFPEAEFVTIPDAGHWLHAEQSSLLVKNIKYFLNR